MYARTITLLLLLIVACRCAAQVRPADGSKLNYRLIGFTFPATSETGSYEVQIAAGTIDKTRDFEKSIIKTYQSGEAKLIAEVPWFGRQYTWRAVYKSDGHKDHYSELHYFSTDSIPETDTNKVRLRIIKPAVKYADGYVFVEDRILYDMNGHPIWFLPDIEGLMKKDYILRDIKLSPRGTITFLLNEKIYEIDYDGHILWKGPDNGAVGGDTTEHYHHEFTRLANGHYMVLGKEIPYARRAANEKNGTDKHDAFYDKSDMGTIIEYDEKGRVVWSWKSSGYFNGSDVSNFTMPRSMAVFDAHENSFFFDKKDSIIYLSFRHISRILKLKYPEGKVLNTYGEIYEKGIPQTGNGTFCGQHSTRLSDNGYLYMYNNGCDPNTPPKVTRLREPAPGKDSVTAIWEYTCDLDGLSVIGHRVFWVVIGGNVVELPDRSMFVCMGSDYGKLFIVGEDKQLLWSSVPEKWSPERRQWEVISQYRGGIISDSKQMDALVWGNGK